MHSDKLEDLIISVARRRRKFFGKFTRYWYGFSFKNNVLERVFLHKTYRVGHEVGFPPCSQMGILQYGFQPRCARPRALSTNVAFPDFLRAGTSRYGNIGFNC